MTDKQKDGGVAIQSALDIILRYGGIDGEHHKQWVLDQVVRTLTECPVETKTAKDYKGNDYTFEGLGKSQRYLDWLAEYSDGEDGPDTYGEWDEGIAP